jgi:acyl CoA:acetate/3-ketoacid CoA transferase beta subunit
MTKYAKDYSVGELMCVTLAREIEDGDVIVLGSFTPLAYASYILAKITHAPNSTLLAYAAVDFRPFQLSFIRAETAATRGAACMWTMLEDLNSVHLKGRGDIEAISSIQADGYGNINLSVVGDYNSPKLRGPGGAGAPEVIKMHRKMIGYFPNHSKMTFVPKVDVITGTRYVIGAEERIKSGYRPGPIRYITNLTVISKEVKDRPFKIDSLHPGISAAQVVENTGFELEVPKDIPETEKPTEEQVRLLREEVDPYNTIAFDFKPGKERLVYLNEILQKELDAIGYA